MYNYLLTAGNLLFPILTFPYVSRIVGPDGIGTVSYAIAVASYFVVIANFGLNLYGVKALAQARNSTEKSNQIFSSLITISIVSTAIALLAYLIVTRYFFTSSIDINLIYLMGIYILANGINTDWVFGAFEDFRYIALRNTLIRLISLASIYLLIKTKNDIFTFAAITVGTTVLNNSLNLFSSRKYVKFVYSYATPMRHLKPSSIIFLSALIGSIYNCFDITILGIQTNASAVGYFSTAKKITAIAVSAVSAVGTALLPRLSNLLEQQETARYLKLIEVSLRSTYFIAVPSALFLFSFAQEIFTIFGGNEFIKGSSALALASPSIVSTSLATFLGFQIILPANKERYLVLSSIAGATVNMIINIVLIKKLEHNASSLALTISETTVTILQIFFVKKIIRINFINTTLFASIVSSLTAIIFVNFSGILREGGNLIEKLLQCSFYFSIIYLMILTALRESIVMQIAGKARSLLFGEKLL